MHGHHVHYKIFTVWTAWMMTMKHVIHSTLLSDFIPRNLLIPLRFLVPVFELAGLIAVARFLGSNPVRNPFGHFG